MYVPGTYIQAGAMDAVGGGGRRALCSSAVSVCLAVSALTLRDLSFGRRKVVYPGNSVGGSRGEVKSAALPPGPGSHGNALREYIYVYTYGGRRCCSGRL